MTDERIQAVKERCAMSFGLMRKAFATEDAAKLISEAEYAIAANKAEAAMELLRQGKFSEAADAYQRANAALRLAHYHSHNRQTFDGFIDILNERRDANHDLNDPFLGLLSEQTAAK